MNCCDIFIIDNTTKRRRKCKKILKFIIQDKKCCTIHANSLYIKYIIKIQKAFRTFKIYKKSKYFIALPEEIKYKIISYITNGNENEKIAKIILNKIDLFVKKYFNISQQINYLFGVIEFYNSINNLIDIELYHFNVYLDANYLINHVLYLFYLLDKYQQIMIKQKIIYEYNYRRDSNVSSMFTKFLSLREKILKYRKKLVNIENYKYINSVFSFIQLYKI